MLQSRKFVSAGRIWVKWATASIYTDTFIAVGCPRHVMVSAGTCQRVKRE
jgi:hypothetical protein